jgi:hypothetical protein
MAQLAVIGAATAGGGIAGGLIPGVGVLLGAQVGFLGGSILAGILFPNEIDVGGPARDDVRLGSAATGRFIPIPMVGSVRIAGQYRWLEPPLVRKFTDEIGGKGGGTEVEGTKLFLTWNVGICEAPDKNGIAAITKIWLDDELVFDISEGNPIGPALLQSIATGEGLPDTVAFQGDTQEVTVESYGPIRIYLGQEGQQKEPLMQVDPRITEAMGSDASNWISRANGLCHATFMRIPGDQVNNHFPLCEFEVLVDATAIYPSEHFEPVPSRNRENLLLDGTTFVAFGSTSDSIYRWNMVDKNPETPEIWEWTETFVGTAYPPSNIGTWDDPDLNVPIISTGGSFFAAGKALTGFMGGSASIPGSLAQIRPDVAYYYPNTASPTHVFFTQGSLDFMRTMSFDFVGDGEAIERGNVEVPELGITTLSFTDRPGLVHDDGLVYLASGESGTSRRCIIAVDPLTLNIEKAALPYTESPDVDDPFYTSCELTYDPITDKLILVSANGSPESGTMRRMDRETLQLDDLPDLNLAISFANAQNEINMKHGPSNGVLWMSGGFGVYHEVDVWQWQVLRTITAIDLYGAEAPQLTGNNFRHSFDPWNHGLWVADFLDTDQLHLLYLDRRGPACGAPSIIAANVSDRCDVPSTLRDVTAWGSDLICGYLVGRRISGRKGLEPIAGAINGDYRTQDAKVQFYKNDTASILTVPDDQLHYAETIDHDEVPPDISWPYERELPYRLDLTYIDRQTDYAPNTFPFDRPQEGFRGRDRQTVQMPIVFDTPSDPTVPEITERMLYQFDLNRERHVLLLSFEYLNTNVGDAISYTKGTRTHTVRIEKWALAEDNRVAILAKSEDVSINTSSGVANASASLIFQRPELESGAPGGDLFLFDTSLLRDVDDASTGAPVYIGVSPRGDPENFKGGAVLRSTDGGATWATVAVFGAGQTLEWGIAPTALQNTRPGVIDRTGQLTVNMVKGILNASVSESDMNEDDTLNALLYGRSGRWEVMRYQISVDSDGSPDESGDTYVVSQLRRGQANTELNTQNHVDGDLIIKLDPNSIKRIDVPASHLDVEYIYKFVPVGTPESLAAAVNFTLTGESKKPPRLVEVKGTRDISTGAWTVTGCRGGRTGYDWVDFVSTPLGEDSEEYEIEVLSGPGGSVVLTKTGLTTASVVFTEAELHTAGLGTGSPDTDAESPFNLTVKWYQISAIVGRGQTEEVTLTSPTPGSL